MAKRVTGKESVFITGVTGGIGSSIAETLAARGFNIIGQHYSAAPSKIRALARKLERFKVKTDMAGADLSRMDDIERLLEFLDEIPALNLVNNAGALVVQKDFAKISGEEVEAVMRVNFLAPFLITQRMFPRMRKAGYGRIVNISSIAAKYGGSMSSLPYGSAKRALEGMTRTLARAGAKRNILINNIRPGVIDTPFHTRYPKDMKARIALIPMGRMGSPEDVARTAAFFIDGNEYMTGQTITIAGGE